MTLDAITLETIDALHRHDAMVGPWMLAPGGRPVSPDRISAWLRRARDRAGMEPRWRCGDASRCAGLVRRSPVMEHFRTSRGREPPVAIACAVRTLKTYGLVTAIAPIWGLSPTSTQLPLAKTIPASTVAPDGSGLAYHVTPPSLDTMSELPPSVYQHVLL